MPSISRIAVAALFVAGTFAMPAPAPALEALAKSPAHPVPPPTPPTNNQQNVCGNNNQPYCCSSDNKGTSKCTSMGAGSSQCGTTIVCCNAQQSAQLCLGNINVNVLDGFHLV